MTTNFPTSLDTFSIPSGTATLGGSTPTHTQVHTNTTDAIAALEAKVGVDSSAVTTSLDYKVANRVQVAGDIGGTAASPQVTATHLSAALPIAQGGTGSTTQNFVDLSSTQASIGGNKTFTGNVSISGVGGTLYATKSASTSRNTTTTVSSDPHLTLSVAANATYLITCVVVWTNGGGGFRAAFTGPSGATMVWTDNDGTGNGAIGTQSTFNVTTGTTFEGALITGGSSGTFALQWAQSSSNAANTTLLAGCVITAKRLA